MFSAETTQKCKADKNLLKKTDNIVAQSRNFEGSMKTNVAQGLHRPAD